MTIETSILARNNTDKVIHVDRNTCPSGVAIFPTADRTGTPEWSSNGGNYECATWAGPLDLAPGVYYEFSVGGTLPITVANGIHFVVADIYLGPLRQIPAGQFVTNSGTVSVP
jgi:hypothetical protein